MDVLVVIDGLLLGSVVTCVDWLFQVANVEDVGHRILLSCGTNAIFLVEFVIEHKVLLPVAVENSTLMCVCSADIRSARDDLRGIKTSLVSHIIDGESVFVVAVADIATKVALVRTTINKTFGVVDVAILTRATRGNRLGDVTDIDEDETSSASTVARLSSNRDCISKFLVDDDIVSATDRKVSEQSSDICSDAEVLRVSWIDVEQFVHVEELDAMVVSLSR